MTARILVVEDDHIVALEIQDGLQSLGYTVVGQTSTGEDAIEKTAEMQPDLVLMDIGLKGAMDGVEAAAEIGARFDVPVVYLTAYADEETLQRAKITEPYGYIIKPFRHRELHTAIDIALYKHKMERKLKESEQWLNTTLRSMGDAVLATDNAGYITFMNPVAEALTRWNKNEALGKRVTEVFRVVPEERPFFTENPAMRTLRGNAGVDLARSLLITKDGTEIPIEGSSALIRDDIGNVDGVVLIFRDISDRRAEEREREKLQAQLFQAQKMEALGLFAGGIAHDLSNQMTPVVGYSSLVLSWLPDDDPMRDRIEVINRSGERASALIQQILAFSRKQMPKPRVLDLNAVVDGIDEMLQRLIGEDTEVIRFLEPGFKYVKADPTQIEQVLINLTINALDAMPKGGKLTIKTEYVTVNEDELLHPEAHPGNFVCLTVTDTGVGMDEETIQHLFEPFFSTKERGIGLGLSTVYTIVKQYDGWIDVHSELGQGSTFQVYLPACDNLEYETFDVTPITKFHGRGERILLVEDDDDVRAAVSEMLRAGGYSVFDAESADAALRVFEEEKGDFHLVFSDVVLPNRDGIELVDQLLAYKPALSVVLSSGYTDKRSQWPMIRERGFHYLQKPYGLSELLPVVKEAILSGERRVRSQATG